MKQFTATQGCHNLRNAYRAVEESEISTLMAVALKSVGDKGKRHGKHGCPSATYEPEWKYEQISVAYKRHDGETYAANDKTQGVCQLLVLNLGSTIARHRTDGLPEEQYAHPVACLR